TTPQDRFRGELTVQSIPAHPRSPPPPRARLLSAPAVSWGRARRRRVGGKGAPLPAPSPPALPERRSPIPGSQPLLKVARRSGGQALFAAAPPTFKRACFPSSSSSSSSEPRRGPKRRSESSRAVLRCRRPQPRHRLPSARERAPRTSRQIALLRQLSLPREERMKSPLVLTVLLSLITAKLCHAYCIESQEQQIPSGMQTKKSSDFYKTPPSLLRRLYDGQGISYEALLRLSGKEEVRDMHDFFVGLMGKRTTEPDNPTDVNKGTLTGFGDLKYSLNAE
uniref:Uncharacterized protein n=1 Tax=Podarcis muralis TaxID=64176 RepID=A0A670KJK3_PODMU